MDPQRWQRMWELFHRALEREPEERAAFVTAEADDDEELREEVLGLLAGHEGAPSLLDPLHETAISQNQSVPATTIDGYRLDRLIGRGGMGEVYASTQLEPIRRTVALKLVKPGMDTAEVVARFEAERQALALMDHPNIATVHDAGATTEGRPYFVMELVDGQTIVETCDEARMPVHDRLELFLPVCNAVQHAHQKGVIHRDLKPSNILVTEHDREPVPKIIDFGIAKAVHRPLTDHTLTTIIGKPMGTPAYMSPEQASGAPDVDTRSDVYSLGMVLYELLAGSLPLDRDHSNSSGGDAASDHEPDLATPSRHISTAGAGEIAEMRSTDSEGLRQQLSGDLDWIVMRALEHDRDRRYATAAELAADLERHLRDEPVLARPPDLSDRVRKFTRRHRFGVAVGATLVLTLLVGIVGTTWMALVALDERHAAEAARDKARAEAETARAVTSLFNRMLGAPNPMSQFTSGATRDITVLEVLDRSDEFLPDLAERPAVEAEFRRTLGQTYIELGELETAEGHVRRAVELNQRELGPDHLDTLASGHHLAWVLSRQGKMDEAEAILAPVLEARRRVLGPEHADTLASSVNLANIYFRQNRLEEAEALLNDAIPMMNTTLGETDPDTLAANSSFVLVLAAIGRHDEAETTARRNLRLCRQSLGPSHPRTLNALGNLGAILEESGELEEAAGAFAELVEVNRKVLGGDHPSTLLSMQNLAAVFTRMNRPKQAVPIFREVLATYREILGATHPNTMVTAHNLARGLTDSGEASEAVEIYDEILGAARKAFGPDHYLVATFEGGLGASLLELGRFAEAEVELVGSYDRLNESFGPDNRRTISARQRLVELYEAWNRPEKAEQYR